jgi:phage portal protein BeeE
MPNVRTTRARPLVLTAPEAKAGAARRLIAMTSAGQARWTPRDYAALAREGFAKNPVAYRCIRMIAEAAASVPLVAFADGARAPDHPLQVLIDRPNPEESAPDLMEAFFAALQTAGNAYLEAAGAGDAPTELYALRPDRVQVVPGPQGWPSAYLYNTGGRTARIGRDA